MRSFLRKAGGSPGNWVHRVLGHDPPPATPRPCGPACSPHPGPCLSQMPPCTTAPDPRPPHPQHLPPTVGGRPPWRSRWEGAPGGGWGPCRWLCRRPGPGDEEGPWECRRLTPKVKGAHTLSVAGSLILQPSPGAPQQVPLLHVSLGSEEQRQGKGQFHLHPMVGGGSLGGWGSGKRNARLSGDGRAGVCRSPDSLAAAAALWECMTPRLQRGPSATSSCLRLGVSPGLTWCD